MLDFFIGGTARSANNKKKALAGLRQLEDFLEENPQYATTAAREMMALASQLVTSEEFQEIYRENRANNVEKNLEMRRVSSTRFRIGQHLLREPDCRQILSWAEASESAPEQILEQLSGAVIDHDWETIDVGFAVEDGAIISLISALPAEISAFEPCLPQLTELYCYKDWDLRKLDLSRVPKLTKLHLEEMFISVDLSPARELKHLIVRGNDLAELDLSSFTKLIELNCSYNSLSELDLSNLPDLTKLNCVGNNLKELELSSVPKLGILNCDPDVVLRNAPAHLSRSVF